MCNYSSRAALASLALMLVIGAAATATAQPRDPNIIYSSVPKQLPGNVASEGPEAYAFKELGDGIVATPGSGGVFDKVKVILSSWGCTSGHWYSSDCVTQPRNAKFNQPITLNIYSVIDVGGVPTQGTLLATKTKTFEIPYRPSSDPSRCPADYAGFSRWYSDKDKVCYHGLAVAIDFDLDGHVPVPDRIIVGVTFNSSHYGYVPIGESAPCYTSSGGCPYDSLNISTDGAGGLIGSVIDPNGIFINYTYPSSYCQPHVYQGNVMQLDNADSCWTGYHPQIEVVAKDRKNARSNGKAPLDP